MNRVNLLKVKEWFRKTKRNTFSSKTLTEQATGTFFEVSKYVLFFLVGYFISVLNSTYTDKDFAKEILSFEKEMESDGFVLMDRKITDLHGFGNNSVISVFQRLSNIDYDGNELDFNVSGKLVVAIHDRGEESYVLTETLEKGELVYNRMEVKDLNDDNRDELQVFSLNNIGGNHPSEFLNIISWNGDYFELFNDPTYQGYPSESLEINGNTYDAMSKNYYEFEDRLFEVTYMVGPYGGGCCPDAISIKLVSCDLNECTLSEESTEKTFTREEVVQGSYIYINEDMLEPLFQETLNKAAPQ